LLETTTTTMPQAVPASILIVDDDALVRKVLRQGLSSEGYETIEAKDGAEMQASLEGQPVDLITLDLKLDREDGLALARAIRTTRNIPIVMITGKGKAVDRIVGLELGADDYIAKPFNVREVAARVRAVLRRYQRPETAAARPPESAPARYCFNGWVFDEAQRQLFTPQGTMKPITTSEFNLLAVFVRCPQRVLTRDEIMEVVKGQEWSPFDRSIDSSVAKLRKKIEPDRSSTQLIKTVHGLGYVFVAEVQRL
jgi:two-component system, OmpR family, response regulator